MDQKNGTENGPYSKNRAEPTPKQALRKYRIY